MGSRVKKERRALKRKARQPLEPSGKQRLAEFARTLDEELDTCRDGQAVIVRFAGLKDQGIVPEALCWLMDAKGATMAAKLLKDEDLDEKAIVVTAGTTEDGLRAYGVWSPAHENLWMGPRTELNPSDPTLLERAFQLAQTVRYDDAHGLTGVFIPLDRITGRGRAV